MKVYARVFTTLAVVVDSAEQLTVFATVSFFNSGAAVNDTAVAYVGSPNLATGLLIDNQIRTAVKTLLSSSYGITINTSDVILSGGFNLPLL